MHPMGVKDYFFINISVGNYKVNMRMSFYYKIGFELIFLGKGGNTTG